MIAVTPQRQHNGPPCSDVSAASSDEAAASLDEMGEGRLGGDLEGTQLLHFGCHCCKSINVLICSKTPDGSWLLRRATAGEPAAPAALDEVTTSAPLTPSEVSPEECNDIAGEDRWTGETEKASTGLGASFKVTILPAADCISDGVSTSRSNSRRSSCSKGQDGAVAQAGQTEEESACAGERAAAATAVAIAAPAQKREASKTTNVLRPLATNSTASTCSSWECADARAGDEPPTPSDGPTPRRPIPKESTNPVGYMQQQQQQKRQQKMLGSQRKDTAKQLQQQEEQQREVGAASSSKTPPAEDADGTLDGTPKDSPRNGKQQKPQSSSISSRKPENEVDTPAEEAPKPAVAKAFAAQQHEQKKQQQEQQEEQHPGAEGAKGHQTSDGSSSINTNSSNGSSNTQADAITEMAAYMVTRECEGDGNCLYRAFSDQVGASSRALYGEP